MRIYLAGPINGCTDLEARGWREEARRLLPGAEFLDPMARDYRGTEEANVEAIVDGDKADILHADAVLVNAQRPTWGTAMEIMYARTLASPRPVFAWVAPSVSPWLRYHADCSFRLEDACRRLLRSFGQ